MSDHAIDAPSTDGHDTATAAASPTRSTGPSVVAVFATHQAAEAAVRALGRAGFALGRLSIVGKDYRTEERAVGFYNVGDRLKVWGSRGLFWGGLIGVLASPALFLIPVVGHVIVLGPLTSALVSALEGAAVGGGAGVLGGALASLGVPRDSVVRYEADIRADRFVLIVHDARDDAIEAEQHLREAGAESVERYPGR